MEGESIILEFGFIKLNFPIFLNRTSKDLGWDKRLRCATLRSPLNKDSRLHM